MFSKLFKSEKRQLVEKAVGILKARGNTDIKALLPHLEAPQKVVRTSTQDVAVPDLSACKDGQIRIFSVESADTIRKKESFEKWRLFSEFASQNNALFFIAYPPGLTQQVQTAIHEAGVDARLWEITSQN